MSEITEAKQALQGVLAQLRKQAFQPMPGEAPPPGAAPVGPPPGAAPAAPPPMDPSQGAPPMDPAMMQQMMQAAGAGGPPPMDPSQGAAPPAASGIDPSTLVQLLQAVEQISQVLQSVAGQQHSQEQKIHHIATEQAKCAGEVALLLKLLKQQPEAPAAVETAPTPEPAPIAPAMPTAGVTDAPMPTGTSLPAS